MEQKTEKQPVLKIAELIEKINAENPKLLQGVDQKQATRFVTLAMKELLQQINAMEEGTLKVQWLGTFNVKKVEREKDGEKTTKRRIIYKPARLQTKKDKTVD